MIGQTISHYKILTKLGEGGMGVVYKAEDTKLKRIVALKFLPSSIMASEAEKTRFVHEAQAAAALNHPNICTIYEIDEIEGQSFIAMEFIEGQSLKAKIEAGPLKLDESLNIAMQVAEGLQAAHEKGIVHRDIKSANIMITEKGQVKIMDFGLAKLAHGGTMLTKAGMTLGTAAYMSPEQARGEAVDHRTDIWSLGVVMYEMLTGRLPFRGEYEAAITYSILNEEPEPITSLRTGVPMELERLANKAMSKKANERYQHVDEMAVDLRNIKGAIEKASTQRLGIPKRKNSRRFWLAVGAGLVLLVLLLISQWSKFTQQAAAGESYLAVMPFENLVDPQDAELSARKLTELTVTVLAQSRSLRVLSSQRLHDVMKQMGKKGLQAVDRTVATAVAKRAGANLMLTGSILQVEPQLVVTLQTVTVATGEVISSHQINGSNLFALADSFRFTLSHPLKFDPEMKMHLFQPVSQISTASDEAYRDYALGLNEMYALRFPAARQHFRQAIAIDSTFAQAYTHLALLQWWSSDFSAVAENIGQALRYLKKLPPKERLFIQGMDDLVRAGNQPQAIRHFQQYVEENPFEKEGFYALGEALYHGGHYEESLPAFRRAMELDPEFSLAFVHLSEMLAKTGRVEELLGHAQKLAELYPNDGRGLEYYATAYRLLGRVDEAISISEKIIAADPNDIRSLAMLGYLYLHRGDYAKAELYYKRLPPAGSRQNAREHLPLIPLRQGKLNEAIRMLRTGLAADSLDGIVGGSTMWKQIRLCYALWLKGDCASVLKNAKRVIAFHSAPYFMRDFYSYYAMCCSAFDDIRQDLAAMEAFKTENPGLYYETLGHLKLGERKLAEAIAALDTAFHISTFHELPSYEYSLALAYFENGQLGEAAGHLENILRQVPVQIDIEAPAILLLGKVYEASGWRKQAVEQYKKLLNMWANGDQDNQLLIEARQRYERLRKSLQ